MAAADVLQMLANSNTKLSDALRAATLLPEVRNDPELLTWIEKELAGYGTDMDAVPDYRRRKLDIVGDATNLAWRHTGTTISLPALPKSLHEYASEPIKFVQSVGTLEDLLDHEPSLHVPWKQEAIAVFNMEIQSGNTLVDKSYRFTDVRWDVPRPIVQEILEIVRHRALNEVADRIPQDQMEATVADALPAAPTTVTVTGSGNQLVVGSPNTKATLTVNTGDRTALNEALASLGIDEQQIDALHAAIDDPDADDSTKVMRILDWSRRTATSLGINTAGSAAATLALQYLGQL